MRFGRTVSKQLWTLQELLSPDRLSPYLVETDGDWPEAIALYDWNTRIGAAFFESIHYLEIGLRNAIHQTASAELGTDWLTATPTPLSPRARRAVSIAQKRAGGRGAPPGKTVAELPLGFWWSLLADEYNRRLWQPALRYAFEGPVRRRYLHSHLDEIRRLRNRIAHHEPIHSRNLHDDLDRVLDVSSRIGETLARHIASTTRVHEVLGERTLNRAQRAVRARHAAIPRTHREE